MELICIHTFRAAMRRRWIRDLDRCQDAQWNDGPKECCQCHPGATSTQLFTWSPKPTQ